MKNILKYKKQIIVIFGILLVLAFTFWWGGNSDSLHGWKVNATKHPVKTVSPTIAPTNSTATPTTDALVESAKPSATPTATLKPTMAANKTPVPTNTTTPLVTETAKPKDSKSKYGSIINPKDMPKPVDDHVVEKDKILKCSLTVDCKTAIGYDKLSDGLREVLPSNGIIFHKNDVEFYKGESVFDILKRELTNAKIHLEFNFTPMYNSVYIEGINNLYEFDCGEQSGWMYKVNDWFPNYGASRYEAQDGDDITWLYTCDLGYDVGCVYLSE